MNTPQLAVFTIGHSNHPPEAFLELLRQHSVDAVADVRSSPYSRYNPDFNKNVLCGLLADARIDYIFRGMELGGRPMDPSCYDADGQVRFELLADSVLFDDGISRIMRAANDRRIALMCSEKDPLNCHRTLLISKSLEECGVDISHILADGSLETHNAAMNRLMDIFKLPHQGDMFRSRREVIADAISRQSNKVAYVYNTAASANWNH